MVQWDFYQNVINEILALRGHRTKIAFEPPNLFGILGLVRARLGFTLVPNVLERFCPKGLTARPILDAGIPISTVAAWRRPPEGSVADFIKILRKTISGLGREGRQQAGKVAASP